MRELIQGLKTGQAHHAYILAGQPEDLLTQLLDLLVSDLKLEIRKSPDVFIQAYEVFSVDDSRLIKDRQKQKALGNNLKLFILAINSISIEAQNALFKTLEEPTTGSHFFLLVRSSEIFLPTVRSRCEILNFKNGAKLSDHRYLKEAKDFLAAEPARRIENIKTLLADEQRSKKSEIVSFLEAIEIVLRDQAVGSKNSWSVQSLTKAVDAKKFVSARGGFPKLVLENLALTID